MMDSENQAGKTIKSYFCERSKTYQELCVLQAEGWASEAATKHFAKQRERADKPNKARKVIFYNMMQQIAEELHQATGVLSITSRAPLVLDLCMAPGGFSAATLKYNSGAQVTGISLPRNEGGHEMLLHDSGRTAVYYLDITMLSDDICGDDRELQPKHQEETGIMLRRCLPGTPTFDLVFCDGQVLRTQTSPSHHDTHQATRLICSQLILAFKNIKAGGTIILLLHKLDTRRTITLLHLLDQCSILRLFKSQRKHTTRNSFYAVAQDVQPNHDLILRAVHEWRETWHLTTFPSEEAMAQLSLRAQQDCDDVEGVLSGFGDRLVALAEPLWLIQKSALQNAPWWKKNAVELEVTDEVLNLPMGNGT